MTEHQSEEDQGCIISLESLAREFTVEASLSGFTHVGIGKPISSQPNYHISPKQRLRSGSAAPMGLWTSSKGLGQEDGLKGPKVAAVIPEAGRSIPDQDEVVRKDDGGLHQC